MKDTLAALGLTEQDVLNRLIDKLIERFESDDGSILSEFENRLTKAVKDKIDERIVAALDQHVLPLVGKKVDEVCLQETNSWGEKKSDPLTFVEYLVKRTEKFITEPVNYAGKTKSEDCYNWSPSTTRIAHMIHEHLKYHIDKAMVQALGQVNSSVRKGLEEAVKIAIQNVKVTVNTDVKS